MMKRAIATYCGPAAIASALRISRAEAATRLREHEPRSRGRFHWNSVAKVLWTPYGIVVVVYERGERPTLAAWLREDGRNAVLFVSHHFVHVQGGRVVEDNGLPYRRGRVKVAILLRRPS